MGRTKRLFYTPGLISLVGLLIALPLFYKKNRPVKQYCLPLFVPKDIYDNNKSDYIFSKYKLEKDISKRKKLNFILNEDKEENKKKMRLIRHEALKLKYTLDAATVIVINLSDSINYGEFVSILDMCVADEHKRYASWDNKFVIFGEPPPKRVTENIITPIYCGTVTLNKKIKKTFSEEKSNQFSEYHSKKGLPLVIGWLTLLLSHFYFNKRV